MTDIPAVVPLRALDTLPDEADRAALTLFQMAAASSPLSPLAALGYLSAFGYVAQLASEARISPALGRQLLPLLARTERLFLRPTAEAEVKPTTYQPDPPWDFVLALERHPHGDGFEITGHLERAAESRPLSAPLVVTRSGWVVFPDGVAHVQHFDAFDLLAAFRDRDRLPLAAGDEAAFLTTLYEQPTLPRLALPEEMALVEVPGQPAPQLKITVGLARRGGGERLMAVLSFRYLEDASALAVSPADPRRVIPSIAERRLLRRDLAAEAEAAVKLTEVGFRRCMEPWNGEGSAAVGYEIARARLDWAVAPLLALGWRVEAEGKPYRRAGRFDLSVTSGVDWFDLDARVDFDGDARARCPELLAPSVEAKRWSSSMTAARVCCPRSGCRSTRHWPRWARPRASQLRFGRTPGGGAGRAAGVAAGGLGATRASRRPARSCGRSRGSRPRRRRGLRGHLRPYQEAGLGWMHVPAPVRLRWLPRRRHGPGQDRTGAGHAGQARRRAARRRPSIGRGAQVADLELGAGGGAVHARLRVFDHVGPERATDAAALRSAGSADRAADDLRDAAPRRRAPARDRVRLRDPRRGAGDQERESRVGEGGAAAARRAPPGAVRARRSRTTRRAVVAVRVPQSGHARGRRSAFEGVAGAERPEPETRGACSPGRYGPFILRRTKEQVAPELPGEARGDDPAARWSREQRRLYDELRSHYRGSAAGKRSREGGPRQVEDPGARGAAAPAPGRLPSGADRQGRAGELARKLDVLLARLRRGASRKGTRPWSSRSSPASWRSCATRLDAAEMPVRISRRRDGGSAGARGALPERSGLPLVPASA